MKKQRNYVISVADKSQESIIQSTEIKYPLTVDFNINRDLFSKMNSAKLRLLNLNENTRSFLYKNRFDISTQKELVFSAGYENNMGIMFKGSVLSGVSYRNGVDYITEVDVMDGLYDFNNGWSNITATGNISQTEALRMLSGDLNYIDTGVMTTSEKAFKRGFVYQGNTIDGIAQISDGNAFIDNGILNFLDDDEVLEGDVLVIEAQTGLLDVPIVENTIIKLDMLLEPKIKLGQVVELNSQNKKLNSQYKVVSINHRGTISESVSSKCITSLSLYMGENPFRMVR